MLPQQDAQDHTEQEEQKPPIPRVEDNRIKKYSMGWMCVTDKMFLTLSCNQSDLNSIKLILNACLCVHSDA